MQDTSRGILVTSLVYLQKQERETEISRQLIPQFGPPVVFAIPYPELY